ncbi:MAG TPA: DUF6807 family protein [Gemmataceae bacterium]|nr:DUF6807 family protein [Gemmataceae bacterium]
MNRSTLLTLAITPTMCIWAISLLAAPPQVEKTFSVTEERTGVHVKTSDGRPVLHYVTQRPKNSKLSVQSACYFHPVYTPKGEVLTDVAPDDHLHHRGVWLAFVEMHGKKDADFWGWGQHAPKDKRVIESQGVDVVAKKADRAELRMQNCWLADGDEMLAEELRTVVMERDRCFLIDLTYKLTPGEDAKIARWAFSGFCFRGRKDGKVVASGPKGKVELPEPSHLKPQTDWPSSPWYDFTIELAGRKQIGMAVLDHPKNPKALWYNSRTARMLNPSICAPGEVQLKANQPLLLRYRLVAHDGPAPVDLLNKVAAE